MDKIIESITEWLKEFFIGAIQTNLSTMFNDVNNKVGTIAGEVGQTPQGWNSSIFDMIKNLSDNVILPIAGIIITYVLCYELIHLVMEKNHGNDMEFWEFFVYFVKMWIAVGRTHSSGGVRKRVYRHRHSDLRQPERYDKPLYRGAGM